MFFYVFLYIYIYVFLQMDEKRIMIESMNQ